MLKHVKVCNLSQLSVHLSQRAVPPETGKRGQAQEYCAFWIGLGALWSDLLMLKLALKLPLHEIIEWKMLLSENLADVQCISLSCSVLFRCALHDCWASSRPFSPGGEGHVIRLDSDFQQGFSHSNLFHSSSFHGVFVECTNPKKIKEIYRKLNPTKNNRKPWHVSMFFLYTSPILCHMISAASLLSS